MIRKATMNYFWKAQIIALSVAVLITAFVLDAKADKRTPPGILPAGEFSYFGTYGLRSYPTQLDGYVYASTLGYQFVSASFYTVSGNAFVGSSPSITEIRGQCFKREADVPMSIELYVDGYGPWKWTANGDTLSFYHAGPGQSFEIKVLTAAPVGCEIVLERIG